MEIVNLGQLGSDKEGKEPMGTVGKEELLKDIQFRGAISDFYAFKQKILDADYDPLIICVNEDDVFGDGNNYQVCVCVCARTPPGTPVLELVWAREGGRSMHVQRRQT